MHHASCIMHQKCFQPPPSFRKMMKKNQIHTKQHAHAKVTPAEAYSCLQVCVLYLIHCNTTCYPFQDHSCEE